MSWFLWPFQAGRSYMGRAQGMNILECALWALVIGGPLSWIIAYVVWYPEWTVNGIRQAIWQWDWGMLEGHSTQRAIMRFNGYRVMASGLMGLAAAYLIPRAGDDSLLRKLRIPMLAVAFTIFLVVGR